MLEVKKRQKRGVNMKIYNTLTKQIEEFKPNEKGIVNIYTFLNPFFRHNLRQNIFCE